MHAVALLLSLLAAAPAAVAEAFPDDDTSAWDVRADVYGETYSDGSTAVLVDVYATPPAGPSEYLLQIAPDCAAGSRPARGTNGPAA
jgi:hypothetical protein